MNRKLNGIAWILFGILLLLIVMGGGIRRIPHVRDLSEGLWYLAAFACGVVGLVTTLRSREN